MRALCLLIVTAARLTIAASPCANALTSGVVCESANSQALQLMNSRRLVAATVAQDVRTGALIAYAASDPGRLDVGTPVLPLSLMKVLLAASWWENRQPDSEFDDGRGGRASVDGVIAYGSDAAGREMALALRRAAGNQRVLADLARFGFPARSSAAPFWSEVADAWRTRLTPGAGFVALTASTPDAQWADVFSIGETDAQITTLHMSRFLQAVGNGGIQLGPVARARAANGGHQQRLRIMREETARRLQTAMRGTVDSGTAKSIAKSLPRGWGIGGKTGTGPGPEPIGPESDGWFAGLVFDPSGAARFTVATYVRHGGTGGGNAAGISSGLARYLIGE